MRFLYVRMVGWAIIVFMWISRSPSQPLLRSEKYREFRRAACIPCSVQARAASIVSKWNLTDVAFHCNEIREKLTKWHRNSTSATPAVEFYAKLCLQFQSKINKSVISIETTRILLETTRILIEITLILSKFAKSSYSKMWKNKPICIWWIEKLWRKNAGMNRNAMGSECFVAWSDYEKATFSL